MILPAILEHKSVLDAWGITILPKGYSKSQETDQVDDMLDDFSTLDDVWFEEESKELLDNLSWELSKAFYSLSEIDIWNVELTLPIEIDKWIDELDYGSLAWRMKVIDSYPLLISSLLELISLHWGDLDGKTVSLNCWWFRLELLPTLE